MVMMSLSSSAVAPYNNHERRESVVVEEELSQERRKKAHLENQRDHPLLLPQPSVQLHEVVQIDEQPSFLLLRSIVVVRILEIVLLLLVLGVGSMSSNHSKHLRSSESWSVGRTKDHGDDVDSFGLWMERTSEGEEESECSRGRGDEGENEPASALKIC